MQYNSHLVYANFQDRHRPVACHKVNKSYTLISNARLKICLSRLNRLGSTVLLATGPDTENARSPSFVRVLGTTYVGHMEDQRLDDIGRCVDRLNHVDDVGWSMLMIDRVH